MVEGSFGGGRFGMVEEWLLVVWVPLGIILFFHRLPALLFLHL